MYGVWANLQLGDITPLLTGGGRLHVNRSQNLSDNLTRLVKDITNCANPWKRIQNRLRLYNNNSKSMIAMDCRIDCHSIAFGKKALPLGIESWTIDCRLRTGLTSSIVHRCALREAPEASMCRQIESLSAGDTLMRNWESWRMIFSRTRPRIKSKLAGVILSALKWSSLERSSWARNSL